MKKEQKLIVSYGRSGSYELLVDSGYQGAQNIANLSVVLSPKKQNGYLSVADRRVKLGRNRKFLRTNEEKICLDEHALG